jgi:hypothetical protein
MFSTTIGLAGDENVDSLVNLVIVAPSLRSNKCLMSEKLPTGLSFAAFFDVFNSNLRTFLSFQLNTARNENGEVVYI